MIGHPSVHIINCCKKFMLVKTNVGLVTINSKIQKCIWFKAMADPRGMVGSY